MTGEDIYVATFSREPDNKGIWEAGSHVAWGPEGQVEREHGQTRITAHMPTGEITVQVNHAADSQPAAAFAAILAVRAMIAALNTTENGNAE